jgi:hypothetical protein
MTGQAIPLTSKWPKRKPLPGDFFVTQISGTFTKPFVEAGQWWCKEPSWASHAGIYMGQGILLEAMPGGAIYTPLSEYRKSGKKIQFSYWDLSDFQRETIVSCAKVYGPYDGTKGVGYSYADYVALGVHRRFPKYDSQKLREYIESSGRMICSQMVDRIYWDAADLLQGTEQKTELHMFSDHRWPGYVMPSHLSYVMAGPVPDIDWGDL